MRRAAGLVGVMVVCSAGTARAAAFGYRKAITIDRTKVGASGTAATTMSNYPMLYNRTDISMSTTSASNGRVKSASGYDIIFRGLDTTVCAGAEYCTFSHELERYTASNGEVVAWVKVPTLKTNASSANTVIYIYYGNALVRAAVRILSGQAGLDPGRPDHAARQPRHPAHP